MLLNKASRMCSSHLGLISAGIMVNVKVTDQTYSSNGINEFVNHSNHTLVYTRIPWLWKNELDLLKWPFVQRLRKDSAEERTEEGNKSHAQPCAKRQRILGKWWSNNARSKMKSQEPVTRRSRKGSCSDPKNLRNVVSRYDYTEVVLFSTLLNINMQTFPPDTKF